ncbi:hypothetical protein M011DRAFT_96437 [Sporormia fimetaria CBS 119925]|uniref:Uncharacterized protein n=1 Tax=Sporormia fimetaria CBS 119925 TaxID=1340428 RepID=A0A6A6V8N8_9PLEO|nr:hypothetical protein M011DRAFT_96437 [Sporormia fimetaria CBS 119925]
MSSFPEHGRMNLLSPALRVVRPEKSHYFFAFFFIWCSARSYLVPISFHYFFSVLSVLTKRIRKPLRLDTSEVLVSQRHYRTLFQQLPPVFQPCMSQQRGASFSATVSSMNGGMPSPWMVGDHNLLGKAKFSLNTFRCYTPL